METAMDVVSDMLLKPKLRQEDIDRERGVIVEEINMYYDTPMRYVGQIFDQMFFRGSGLSHDIIGSKATVEKLNREDFIGFLRHWYGLGNLVLVLAGNDKVVSAPETLELASELFSKVPNEVRPKDKVDIDRWISAKSPVSPHKLTVEERKTEQAHLVIGWPAINRRDPGRYALTVLNVIMGGNMSSRLFTEVREKRGLCYYVRSDDDYYHDAGIFGVAAGVDPSRVEEAAAVIKEEVEQAAAGSKPITGEELQNAKEYLTGSMTLSFEDSRSVAQYYGLRHVLTNEIETPEETLAKIRAVELDEVREMAARVVKEGEMRLAVIGPFADETVFQKYVK
jgi:predicted Zn-dependent peptidase